MSEAEAHTGFDLEHLVARWRGPLVGLLAARGLPWGQAEELAQDVFAEAWMGRGRFQGDAGDERAMGAWLAGIARNLHRTETRRPQPASTDAAVEPQAAGPTPQERLDAGDEAARVHAAIDALPDREREVVRAFYLEETSAARVAALLETSERAVEGLLRRARERLRTALTTQTR